ncbi:cupin domain-containing protein [Thalassotalea agarivorans]|uniref:Cupin 2 domain-containing protein n=1 Tax=Thalassotalea agarivorans TaxID=349064 RepID=A0A1H9ZYS5_THASX|nr:cupin domain-containing protein [Thalassotalea agarivorans]SES86973.1 cupin 2 domain-containing protein [Thalassotalea agarivorans]
MKVNNLFNPLPTLGDDEHFQTLLKNENVHIERIVSLGHSTADGQWYDQVQDEWVVLLTGAATLAFAEGKTVDMKAGDHIHLPAGCKHKVASTTEKEHSVWLAVHFPPST